MFQFSLITKQPYECTTQAYQVHSFENSSCPENTLDRYPHIFTQYPSWFVENTGAQETPAVPQFKKTEKDIQQVSFPQSILHSCLRIKLEEKKKKNQARHKSQISVEVNSSFVISWNKTAMDLFIYFKLRKLLLTPETFKQPLLHVWELDYRESTIYFLFFHEICHLIWKPKRCYTNITDCS